MKTTNKGPYDGNMDFAGRASLRNLARRVCAIDGRDYREVLELFIVAKLESTNSGEVYKSQVEHHLQLHQMDELRELTKEVIEMLTGEEFPPPDLDLFKQR